MSQNDTQKQEAFAKKAYIEFSKIRQLRDDLTNMKSPGIDAQNTCVKQYNETLSVSKETF